MRRQAKDNDDLEDSVYHTPRRIESGSMAKYKPKQRSSQSAVKKSSDGSRNNAQSANKHNSTFFLTEN